SPIHAEGATDIAITGGGIIDGNGDAWREVKRRKVSDDQWKVVLRRGGVVSDDGKNWFPDEGYAKARATAGSLNYPDPSLDEQEIKTFLRPVLVSLRACERVLIEECTFQNSPCWNLHPLYCKDVVIRDVTVRNPHYSANGDGIDIDACENVILTRSSFDVGDDAICIKSGKDEDGRRHARKCRNLIIADCTVYHGHGGFVVGSEMSGGVENIRVTRCRFIGTDVGLRFKSTRGRGGLVKDIWCDHIYMKDIVSYGVIFNLYYAGVAATDLDADAKSDIQPVDETTPEFRDLHFADIVCSGADQAVFINGLPELPVRNVDFRACTFTAKKDSEIHFAENIVFDHVTVNGKSL
ncbi:MAG: right-handed parallel beta-helix repeat-containing protein, partial [Bacteroidales bacterium]|nr:right-handed parallel beta-helix repeat-containing protein [Bacteroidales bacterium]